MLQGAFSQRLPEEIPVTLKPLRYCGYRVLVHDEAPSQCGTFAVVELEGLSLCAPHARTVEHGLAQEGGDVTDVVGAG